MQTPSSQHHPIFLSAEGIWYHEGIEITHQRTLDFFWQNVIYKEGQYFLLGEKHPVPIDVEDTAFFIKKINVSTSHIDLFISDQTIEPLNLQTIHLGENNELYCLIKNKTTRAKFLRPAYYDMMQFLEERANVYGISFCNEFYPLTPQTPQT